uniref:BTB/POZ domain-containing protein At2g04740 isoform X2 n=1 Tax=Rhizophora mucronata TaxID=61149 RepID=A0A2P2JAU3_RHIMU
MIHTCTLYKFLQGLPCHLLQYLVCQNKRSV